MDKSIIKRRFEAALAHYDLQAGVQRDICRRMAAQLAAIIGHPEDNQGAEPTPTAKHDPATKRMPEIKSASGVGIERALEVGAGTGFLTGELTALMPKTYWWLNDLTEKAEPYLEPIAAGMAHEYIWGDAEKADFPSGLGLIASASTVQWFDDLPRFIEKCSAHSVPGALLAISTFGPENFREIKATTGRGLDYYTAAEVGRIVENNGYDILTLTDFKTELYFDSPADVLRHIKATGVSGTGYYRWTAGRLREFDLQYRRDFPAPDSKVSLTYHPIIVVARRKINSSLQ